MEKASDEQRVRSSISNKIHKDGLAAEEKALRQGPRHNSATGRHRELLDPANQEAEQRRGPDYRSD